MADIFGMLSRGLKPLMDLTGQKPDETTLPIILKGEMSELETKKRDALARVGEAACAMAKSGAFDASRLAPLCAAVDELALQIEAKSAEVRNAEATAESAKKKAEEATAARTCPQCGEVNEDGKNFCSQCGAKLGLPTAAKCPGCGAENPPGTRFCGECGNRLAGPA